MTVGSHDFCASGAYSDHSTKGALRYMSRGDDGNRPFVSVLMPVRDEEGYIERSIRAVLSQDYPADRVEIIVADGGSVDRTREIVRGLQEGYPQIRLVDNPGQIAPTGLNVATRVAAGDVIVRVDGHCEIAPGYISSCVRHLMEDGVDGVGGSWRTVGETPTAESIAIAVSSRFGVGNNEFRTKFDQDLLVDTIPFPAYLRSTVEMAGPYDEELVRDQDDEYNYRIRDLGGRLLQAGDVYSVYYSRASLKSLFRQYYQYGYWKVRVAQKHPRRMRPRHFIPLVFVLTLGVSALLSPFARVARLTFVMASGCYVLANLAVSASLATRRGIGHLRVLPAVFAALHVGYGLGSMVGVVKFADRWRENR